MKPSPPALGYLAAELATLADRGLLRRRPAPVPTGALSFCSNDYLGLADRSCAGMAGAPASRLVVERAEHQALETTVAGWLGLPEALSFSSGYAANVGAISALASAGDLIVSDAINHASLIDGARLSRATVVVVPHLDTDAVVRALRGSAGRRCWVVTESYFSMDADAPDLPALRAACDEAGAALYVDEAHALGVLGPGGRGLCAAAGVVPDVLVGTFGKAFGSSGAFVAGSHELAQWLWNRARSFVFSTAPSPAAVQGAREGVRLAADGHDLRRRVEAAATRLRGGLQEHGIAAAGFGHIVPWVIGDPRLATRAADGLRDRGIHAVAIRPPSVPEGSARIRLAVTARHTSDDIDRALAAIQDVSRCLRP